MHLTPFYQRRYARLLRVHIKNQVAAADVPFKRSRIHTSTPSDSSGHAWQVMRYVLGCTMISSLPQAYLYTASLFPLRRQSGGRLSSCAVVHSNTLVYQSINQRIDHISLHSVLPVKQTIHTRLSKKDQLRFLTQVVRKSASLLKYT